MNSRLLLICLILTFGFYAIGAEKVVPTQQRSLILKDGYFFPSKIVVFENETLHLMVGNLMGHSTCLANEELQFFINSSPGSVVEKKFHFKNRGNFSFSCPGLKSELVVLVREKPTFASSSKNQITRDPASVGPGVWVPRDESTGTDEEVW